MIFDKRKLILSTVVLSTVFILNACGETVTFSGSEIFSDRSRTSTDDSSEDAEPDEDLTVAPPQIITGSYLQASCEQLPKPESETQIRVGCKTTNPNEDLANHRSRAKITMTSGASTSSIDLKESPTHADSHWQKTYTLPSIATGATETTEFTLSLIISEQYSETLFTSKLSDMEANNFSFALTSPTPMEEYQCTEVRISMLDSNSQPMSLDSKFWVDVTADEHTLYSDSNCVSATSTSIVAANSAFSSVYIRPIISQPINIKVSAAVFGKNTSILQTPIITKLVKGIVAENCTDKFNCFTSLAAWQANFGGINYQACTAGDLVCLKKSAVASIEGTWTNPESNNIKIDNWATDPSFNVTIETAINSRHEGQLSAGKYSIVPALEGNGITVNTPHTTIDGVIITGIKGAADAAIKIQADNTTIKNVIAHDLTPLHADAVKISHSNIKFTITNSVFFNISRSAVLIKDPAGGEPLQNVIGNISDVTIYNTCEDPSLCTGSQYPTVGFGSGYAGATTKHQRQYLDCKLEVNLTTVNSNRNSQQGFANGNIASFSGAFMNSDNNGTTDGSAPGVNSVQNIPQEVSPLEKISKKLKEKFNKVRMAEMADDDTSIDDD